MSGRVLEHRLHGLGRVVATGGVLDRDRKLRRAVARERGVAIDDVQLHLPEDELEIVVDQQRPRQQAAFAEDLEAVADAQHEPALVGELDHRLHHRSEARDRSGAQIVPIGEAAGNDDGVNALQVAVAVPEQLGLGDSLGRELCVDVVAGPGEADYAELHAFSMIS